MALLNRFFPSRKKAQRSQRGYVPFSSKELKWEPFDFAEDQVRVILFRECERRGRKLLFDSKSVKKIPLQSNQPCTRTKSGSIPKANEKKPLDPPFVEVTNGFGYQYFTKSGPDVKLLGEMIFGSVAMTVRGSTLKVHVGGQWPEDKVEASPTIMLTKVALSPVRGKRNQLSESFTEDSCGSSINSMSELVSSGGSSSDSKLYNNFSHHLDVPNLSRTQLFLGTDSDVITKRIYDGVRVEDSGGVGDTQSRNFCSNTQPVPVSITVDHERKVSGGSLSSVRRRWLRSTGSCLECQSSQSQLDSLNSCGSLNGSIQEGSGSFCGIVKRSKLGTSIVINLTSEQSRAQLEFILEHAALLESILLRLHASMELAYLHKDLFISMMMKAAADVQQSICDLLCGPRLAAPVWLSLMSVASYDHSSLMNVRSSIAASFLYDLCHLLDMYDLKDTNFFISTLITAVLTHHLGWVSTVINNSQSCAKTLSEISKWHPYNPLWAQMMDLCGAVGAPLKTARTIVVSETPKSRVETVERLLRVVSFFIRCSGLENLELSEKDCPTLESQGSDATLVASETPSRDPSGVSFCEVTIQSRPTDRSKNDQNWIHRSDSSQIIINSSNIVKEPVSRSAKEKINGLRRTTSYSVKMSKEDEPEKAVEAADLPSLTRVTTRRHLSQVEPEPLIEEKSKVMFVLGENEDLVGLKSKTRTAQQSEQALSEVESGFSECDSLELSPLSPVRNSRPTKPKPSQWKCSCETWKFNTSEVSRTCLLDVTNDLSLLQKSQSVHSSMMQLEQETNRKHRFLSRSFSVNLPVCQRQVKQAPQTCNKCGGSSGASNGNLKRTCSKKDVCRRLHKASSLLSFNAKGVSSPKAGRENCWSPCRKSRSSDEVCPERLREQKRLEAGDAACTSDVRSVPLTRLNGEKPEWSAGIAGTLFGGVTDHYVSDRALQGIVTPSSGWPFVVKRDLSMDATHPILDPEISEAVAIIGCLDTCQVDILSSNAPHRGELFSQGARVTLSRLVANMLESVRHLWHIGTSPELCVNVLEERLGQLCSRSFVLVDLLLSTELCDIDTVTSALSIDANDVPLLLAVASTFSPEVTRRYGVSFR